MMQIVNKQIKIPKTSKITIDYIQKYLDGINAIRWAIVAVEEDFYLIDAVIFD